MSTAGRDTHPFLPGRGKASTTGTRRNAPASGKTTDGDKKAGAGKESGTKSSPAKGATASSKKAATTKSSGGMTAGRVGRLG